MGGRRRGISVVLHPHVHPYVAREEFSFLANPCQHREACKEFSLWQSCLPLLKTTSLGRCFIFQSQTLSVCSCPTEVRRITAHPCKKEPWGEDVYGMRYITPAACKDPTAIRAELLEALLLAQGFWSVSLCFSRAFATWPTLVLELFH